MRSKDQTEVEWCMRAAGQVVRDAPEVPSEEDRVLRAKLILEEAFETVWDLGVMVSLGSRWIGAVDLSLSADVVPGASKLMPDIEGVADGCADIIVVTLGTLSAFGIDADAVLDEVHRANRAKFPGGKAILRDDGKYLKPEGWQPPDIAGVLKAQGWSG